MIENPTRRTRGHDVQLTWSSRGSVHYPLGLYGAKIGG